MEATTTKLPVMQFNWRIQRIPCQIKVFSVDYEERNWDNPGYFDADWIVLDRRGYTANWLAKKMSVDDETAVSEEIIRRKKEGD